MTLLHQAAQKAVEALNAARDRIACSVCHHDETQRRGFIWTECLQCGAMFADDKGGVPAPKEPEELAQIDAAIASLSALQQQPEPVAEPPWWGAALNRRATVEQWMFDAARGKRTMPTPDELRAWAIKLGTPADGEPALQHQEVPREPVAFHTGEALRRAGIVCGRCGCPDLMYEGVAASPSTTRQQEARCGSHECKAAQQDGVICADGECDIAAGQRAAAPSTPEKAGGVPARLWAMHIAGPDDVYAAPGEAEARAAAERFNEWFAQRKDPHPLDPQMHATAIEWPHSAEAHGNDLPRWRDFVLPAAGVEGKCECGLSEVACRDPLRRSCPDGMSASVSHPLPAQANDGGEHG